MVERAWGAGKRICREIRSRSRFMRVKVWNCVVESLGGVYQLGICHTEWQAGQHRSWQYYETGIVTGGMVSEKCINLFSSVSGKNHGKTSHIIINNYKIMALKWILFFRDKKMNIYVSVYISYSMLKAAKKCKILFLLCISFVLSRL